MRRLLLLLAFCATPLSAQVTVGGYVQTALNTTTVAGEKPAAVELRRLRVQLRADLYDRVHAEFQPELGRRSRSVVDAFIRLKISPSLQLQAGRFLRPFSLVQLSSSSRMLPIERGLRIRGVDAMEEYDLVSTLGYANRTIGAQVMGQHYAAGVFREGQFVARVTAPVHEDVRVGAAWSSRRFEPDSAADFRGQALEIDIEAGGYEPGLHLVGEVAYGDASEEADFFGAQGWLGWRSTPVARYLTAVEPILRVSYGDYPEATALLTPGINFYLGGRNRLMLNYDFVRTDTSEGAFRAQLQLGF